VCYSSAIEGKTIAYRDDKLANFLTTTGFGGVVVELSMVSIDAENIFSYRVCLNHVTTGSGATQDKRNELEESGV